MKDVDLKGWTLDEVALAARRARANRRDPVLAIASALNITEADAQRALDQAEGTKR